MFLTTKKIFAFYKNQFAAWFWNSYVLAGNCEKNKNALFSVTFAFLGKI
jgi:hypothetical protein